MPEVSVPLAEVTAEEGGVAVFTCRGRGKPVPLVIWSYNGQPIQQGRPILLTEKLKVLNVAPVSRTCDL